jgi:hypothetical protein
MAKAAALAYLNSFPPEEQQRIRDSWGGGDLADQWFQNAVDAGAVNPDGTRKGGEMTSDLSGKGGGWNPQRIREHFQSMGYDTFDQVDDNTMWTWINQGLWDPARQVFKPERQGVGDIDYSRQPDFKPQDCPEGQTPLGSSATAKCVPNSDFDSTGAYNPSGAAAATATSTTPSDPLQQYLEQLMLNRGGYLGDEKSGYVGKALSGGGIMWSPLDQKDNAAAPAPAPAPAPTPTKPEAPPNQPSALEAAASSPVGNPFAAPTQPATIQVNQNPAPSPTSVQRATPAPVAPTPVAPVAPASGGLLPGLQGGGITDMLTQKARRRPTSTGWYGSWW